MKSESKKLINRKRLLSIVPMSDRTIYDMEQRGEFPRRFAITPRMVAWDLQEVEDWMEQKKLAARLPSVPQLKT